MKKKIFNLILVLSVLIIFGLVLTPFTLNKQDGFLWYLKQLVPEPIKLIIKDKFFEKESNLKKFENLKIAFDKLNVDNYILRVSNEVNFIANIKIKSKKNNQYSLKKLYLPFGKQDSHFGKPSGYLEIYKGYIILVSGRAEFILIKKEDLDNKNVKFINLKNNFKDLVKNKNFYLPSHLGLRDLKIIDDYIFLSYTKSIRDPISRKECSVLSILSAKIDFNFLKFNEFFSQNRCPNKISGVIRSGGRLEGDDNKIFLTIGDFGDIIPNQAPQNSSSLFGKIISIDRSTKKVKIISLGHRNQQGLFYDKKNNFLISSEHGPDGGDEINVINLTNNIIENFGWPISSYGKHYKSTIKGHHDTNTFSDIKKYAPLNKSHKNFGFIEPSINWTPSIGISQIFLVENFNQRMLFVSALGNNIPEGDMTIHQYKFADDYKFNSLEDKIIIGERIRDMIYDDAEDKILLLLENTPALGILKKL